MTKYTKTSIIEKANEIAKMIASTEEVEIFKQAETKINENEKIQLLIAEIKAYQKQAVNLQHYEKTEAAKKMEAKIDKLNAQLDEFPIVQQFKRSQQEVNDLLQMVAHTISNEVTDEIIRSTGGDLLKGTTGSQEENDKGCGSGSC
jgi:cell fate (sporulation/competence/biofilm development) regulator YmcA (YheA/YmcA/DUF963 family)